MGVVTGSDVLVKEYFGDDVAASLLDYQPSSIPSDVWEQIREFTLQALVRAQPKSMEFAHKLTHILVKYLSWAFESGYLTSLEDVFTSEMVETWREVAYAQASQGRGPLHKDSVGDYVSKLRQIGPRIHPQGLWPASAGVVPQGARRTQLGPYTDDEVAQWVRAIKTAPAGWRRDRAEAFLGLSLGAGLTPAEYRGLCPNNVQRDGRKLWVVVEGKKPRRIPVARPWDAVLRRCLDRTSADEPLVPLTASKGAFASAVRATRLAYNGASLSPQRLRVTWMVHRLRAGVDPRLLMTWAGLSTLQKIPDLWVHLPEPDPDEGLSQMTIPVGPHLTW